MITNVTGPAGQACDPFGSLLGGNAFEAAAPADHRTWKDGFAARNPIPAPGRKHQFNTSRFRPSTVSDHSAEHPFNAPRHPVTRPPSLTHIAQVRSGWPGKNPVNAELRPGIAQVLEEAPPATEQYRCHGDFQFVDDTQVQALLDHVRPTRDTNITAACGFQGQRQGPLRAVIDEVKARPAGAHPGFALLMGQDVDRRVKRCLLWPGDLDAYFFCAKNHATSALAWPCPS
ncbi:hypothetical protein FQZ97_686020 [compost metagenome]